MSHKLSFRRSICNIWLTLVTIHFCVSLIITISIQFLYCIFSQWLWVVGTVSLILADVLVLSTYINPLFVHVTTTTVPPLSLYFCFFTPTIPWSFTRGRSFMSQYIAHMGISRRRLKKERSITEETSRISSRSVSHLHHFLLSSLGLIVWCLLNLFWLLF